MHVETIVVGMSFYPNRGDFLLEKESRWEGENGHVSYRINNELTLKRESDNKYDEHAVAVLMDGEKIGHINKEDAEEVSEEMDRGIKVKVEAHPLLVMKKNIPAYIILRLYT